MEKTKMLRELEKYGSEEEGGKPKLIKLKSIGLTSIKNISYHIAIENIYGSNAINDISGISYTKNSKGKMAATRLQNMRPFFDDIYFCTYIYKDEYKRESNGKINLLGKSDLKDPNVIPPTLKYMNIVKNGIESILNVPVANQLKIVTTPEFSSKSNSKIIPILAKLNSQSGGEFLKNSKKLKDTEQNPIGIVGIKVSVSNISFELLISNLNLIKEKLKEQGFANYQCDITLDFAGTLDRDELYNFLLSTGLFVEGKNEPKFNFNGEEEEYQEQKSNYEREHAEFYKKRVLIDRREVERTAGYNIVKYEFEKDEVFMKVKYYNKLVSNFEAGNTQEHYGAHLAEYAFNHQDQHLKELYKHPQVNENGVTRLEVSISTAKTDTDYVKLLREEYSIIKNQKIFHIQPKTNQYLNLVSNITKSCVIANRTTKEILIVFYGTSNTRRFCGVNYPQLKQKENETDEEFLNHWEHAKEEAMSDFGFHNLQINLIEYEIKLIDGEKYLFFEPGKKYMRSGPTFLTPTNIPTLDYERFEDLSDMNDFCPDTENIQFRFRIKNDKNGVGKRKILHKPFKIDGSFNIVLLSTRKRKQKLDEEEYELRRYEWWEKQGQEYFKTKMLEEIRERKIKEEMEKNKILLEKYGKVKERRNTLEKDLKINTNQREIEEELLEAQFFKVYAFKICEYNEKIKEKPIRILFTYGNTEEKGVCFPTKELKYALTDEKQLFPFFEKYDGVNTTDKKKGVEIFYMPIKAIPICFREREKYMRDSPYEMVLKKEWLVSLKTKIENINVDIENVFERYEELKKELNKINQPLEKLEKPKPASIPDITKIEEGEYEAFAYSEYKYGSKLVKMLFVKTKDEERYPLQDELEKIEDLSKVKAPIKVLLGGTKKHPKSQKKDRLVTLHYTMI